jgi:hypothetical protein
MLHFLAEKIYEERVDEKAHTKKHIENNIKELEIKKKSISDNIPNIIQYPDILAIQNEELQKLNNEIQQLKYKQNSEEKTIGLSKFKKYTKKILPHMEQLVLQSEKPEVIQLAFDIVF